MSIFGKFKPPREHPDAHKYQGFWSPSMFAAMKKAGWDVTANDSADWCMAVLVEHVADIEYKAHFDE